MPVVESFGKGVDEISPSDRELGIAPMDCITGEGGGIAKVFKMVSTVPAAPVNPADPRNTHTGTRREGRRGPFDHLTYNLVTGDEVVKALDKVAVDDMQICPAHTTCAHAQ
jgi:hypothetical protein